MTNFHVFNELFICIIKRYCVQCYHCFINAKDLYVLAHLNQLQYLTIYCKLAIISAKKRISIVQLPDQEVEHKKEDKKHGMDI